MEFTDLNQIKIDPAGLIHYGNVSTPDEADVIVIAAGSLVNFDTHARISTLLSAAPFADVCTAGVYAAHVPVGSTVTFESDAMRTFGATILHGYGPEGSRSIGGSIAMQLFNSLPTGKSVSPAEFKIHTQKNFKAARKKAQEDLTVYSNPFQWFSVQRNLRVTLADSSSEDRRVLVVERNRLFGGSASVELPPAVSDDPHCEYVTEYINDVKEVLLHKKYYLIDIG